MLTTAHAGKGLCKSIYKELAWNPWHNATAMEFGTHSVSVFDAAVTMQGTSPHQWLGWPCHHPTTKHTVLCIPTSQILRSASFSGSGH
jgi:hypothetical protein